MALLLVLGEVEVDEVEGVLEVVPYCPLAEVDPGCVVLELCEVFPLLPEDGEVRVELDEVPLLVLPVVGCCFEVVCA